MCEDCGAHGDDAGHSHPAETGHGHSHHHASDHVHSNEQLAGGLSDGIRVAVTGKGGVGKTTLSAAIASHLAAHRAVVAVDADPDMNLAGILGVEEPPPPPITTERELIEERAGGSGLVNLTPAVQDVLDSHSTEFGVGGRLLTIGAPTGANSGCMCPENSFVRTLVSTALGEDTVVLDMEAGVEHLGRGTAESVDAMLVVVEPSQASIETATRIQKLATELGIGNVQAVVNKTRDNADLVESALPVPVLATLPYDEDVASAAIAGRPPVGESQALKEAAADIVTELGTESDHAQERVGI
ncbi:MAG: ArsA-related P-loop ATPase [Halodesulfurarchaeum sp.]|nr:ArsA-related P-loop ATPase [Halodesulfurarchaeum sp.]